MYKAMFCVIGIALLTSTVGAQDFHAELLSADGWNINVKVHALQETTFLRRGTPFDTNWQCDAFSVFDRSTESRVLHTGPMARRTPPTEADYITLSADSVLSVDVDLSKCYEFIAGRTYTVTLDNINAELQKKTRATFVVDKSSIPPIERHSSLQSSILFEGCSIDEVSETELAITNAIAAVGVALDDNLNQGCANEYFTGLFGTYTRERYASVLATYKLIQLDFQNENYRIKCDEPDCADDDSTYAFVYPFDSERRVHVCGAFWGASTTIDIDSKPGTLIHEISHFADVSGTNDFIYGFEDCQQMAIDDPCRAIKNADNICYYSEQQPVYDNSTCCSALTDTSCSSNSACAYCDGMCQFIGECDGIGPSEECGTGGVSAVGFSTSSPTDFYDTTYSYCEDHDANWADGDGDGCQEYWLFMLCADYGTNTDSNGVTANDNCCICGGGTGYGFTTYNYDGASSLSVSYSGLLAVTVAAFLFR